MQSALQGNTIACLGSGSSKVFLGLMVIKEMSHQIRRPLQDGGKRSIYLADSDVDVDSSWATLYHHTDLAVGRVEPVEDAKSWSAEQWSTMFSTSNVLVLSASTFLHCLDCSYLSLFDVNLIVIDDCHKAVGDHVYVHILTHVTKCGEKAPHLLCLTAAILGSESSNPQELADRIANLEIVLQSKAETSMLVISERFGCRPKESIFECCMDADVTGMNERLGSILYEAWHFLEDCQFKPENHSGKSDPLHVPKFAISECINILQTLGSWCAASIAENLINQLEKIIKHESHQMMKMLIRYTITQLRLVVREFEIGFTPDYFVDELLQYSSPKVRELVNVLRKYKPEMDFMIITREGEGDDTMSDLTDDDDDDDDSLNLSGSDDEDSSGGTSSKGKSKHIHIAVKRKVEKTDPDSLFDDEKKLSGLVFVDNRYVAFALNKIMEEVCSWDENLCFVKSSYITGQGIHRSDRKKDLSNTSRKQEEILRKFRMQDRNLLVSTNMLEEGVDIPKCNLVIRFDPPRDYRSYTLSKGRARARDAEYVILVDQELMEGFSDEIQIFKGIEQVLIGAGRGRQDLEDAQEVQQLDQMDYIPLPVFCPLGQPGAPLVSMKTAIALINRYCAKLPSDAFTHLTPHCRVCPAPSDVTQYVAYLRLPVNSPIKEELQGSVMPSRQLSKMAVALEMCQLLHREGELDDHLQPVGKEMFVIEEEEQDQEWDEEEVEGGCQARPGTTKRKQYYIKKPADAFMNSHPKAGEVSFLYHITMRLTGPITEDQNTRGRKIYAPENSAQSFGILLSSQIPIVPSFPVYTRSGEVTVSVELLSEMQYSKEELEQLTDFHHFVFASVLHLEKDPMVFVPEEAEIGFLIVPLNCAKGSAKLEVEWSFVEKVNNKTVHQKRNIFDGSCEVFQFVRDDFEDAVVMPSYRNIDQPQHFYVAEIRADLSPLSSFPSPELYKTFAAYYTTKYGLTLTNTDQPLLDVDHTSARLNLLTPRYMNQKGRALPTSSQETKRARRENLQQKQILVPELCDVHIFSASLWRKAVCIPAILYRMNYLLLAEELRVQIAAQTGIGKMQLEEGFRFPRLDFGFETNPEKVQAAGQKEAEAQTETENKVIVSSLSEISSKEEKKRENSTSLAAGHESGPEDDKTDTGASSDSDSGVVMSESDSSIASKLASSVSSKVQHKTYAPTSDNFDGNQIQIGQKREDTQTAYYATRTTVDQSEIHVSLSDTSLLKACQDSCTFITPPTSRPLSAAVSESGDSLYEDAEEDFNQEEREEECISICTLPVEKAGSVCDIYLKCNDQNPIELANHIRTSSVSASLSSSSAAAILSSENPPSSTNDISFSPKVTVEAREKFPASKICLLESQQQQAVYSSSHCSNKVPDSITNISHQPLQWNHDSSPSDGSYSHCVIKTDLKAEVSERASANQILKACLPDSSAHSAVSVTSMTSDKDKIFIMPDSYSTQPKSCPMIQKQDVENRKNMSDKVFIEDCDDFLDVTGTNCRKETFGNSSHNITFPSDPEISQFNNPKDEVKMTFENGKNGPHCNLDADWARVSGTGLLTKEWAPDEDLTTFEVDSSGLSEEWVDRMEEGSTDVFTDDKTPPEAGDGNIDRAGAVSGRGDKEQIQHLGKLSEELGNQNNIAASVYREPLADVERKTEQQQEWQTNKREHEPINGPELADKTLSATIDDVEDVAIRPGASNMQNVPSTELAGQIKVCSSGVEICDKEKTETKDSPCVPAEEELGWGSEEARDPSEWGHIVAAFNAKQPADTTHLHLEEPATCNSSLLGKDFKNVESKRMLIISNEKCSLGDIVQSEQNKNTSYNIQNSIMSPEKYDNDKKDDRNIEDYPLQTINENISNSVEKIHSSDFRQESKPCTDDVNFSIGIWSTGQKQSFEQEKSFPDITPSSQEHEGSGIPLLSLDQDTDRETFVGPSPCLLLQALTMSNANDFFSLERLETIGDSFLKYAITVYLYCMYPGIHEGKLSYLRSKQVSNYNLYRLGRRKGLAERMVSSKFEPYENWLPPCYIINEDRRRGPVPKVVIATSNPKLSAAASVNYLIEDELEIEGEDQKKETEAFQAEVEEIARQQEVDQQIDLSSSHSHRHAMIPYCLQLHHGITDKSLADCVEALIGCYLTTCGKQATLTFMSWLGLKVLPRKRVIVQRKGEEVKKIIVQELQNPPSPLLRSVSEAPVLLNRLLEGYEEFEHKIEYSFRDPSYLLQAFTHASYHYNYITDCYQRLEFLGDAILDYVITRHLYEDSQRYSPGILTDLRSALVNNNIFAALAVKWDFHKFFKAISPSLFVVIDKFVVRQKEREDQIDELEEDTEDEDDCDGTEEVVTAAEGADTMSEQLLEKEDDMELEIPKALGDIFESVAGAIYLDSGMSLDAVWRVYYRMMKPHIEKYLKDIPKSPVRELLEMEPETAKFEKPERTLEGKIRVMVNVVGKGMFYGVGRNYRIAKSAAAKKALRFIRNLQVEGQG